MEDDFQSYRNHQFYKFDGKLSFHLVIGRQIKADWNGGGRTPPRHGYIRTDVLMYPYNWNAMAHKGRSILLKIPARAALIRPYNILV